MDSTNEQSTDNVAEINIDKINLPPSIFIQAQLNFNTFCIKLKEITDSTSFACKTTTKVQSNQETFKLNSLCYSKVKVEAPYTKKEISNASIVSLTVTPVVTAIILQDAFAVGIPTTLSNVKNLEMNQPNAHFVDAHILLTTEDVSPTRISSNTENFFQIQIQTSEPDSLILTLSIQISPKISHRLNISPLPNSNSSQPQAANQEKSDQSSANNLSVYFSSFVNELKSLINPLISLVTTFIEKFILNNGRH
ncbi:hypothetical protein QTP88_013000 [Uroleucon formosanum]